MTIEGVDYAWERPDPVGLAKVGKRFACRYGGPGSAGKQLDRQEALALAAAGLSIVANAEGLNNGLLGGRGVGIAWASQAHDHFVACGMPPDKPIYLSVDFDVKADDWSQVRDALDGAGDTLGHERVGVYGGYDAIAWAARDNVARWFWQTFAWSEGRWHDRAHIQQYRNGVSLVGGTVDYDRAMVTNYGQWSPLGAPGGEGEDDMALTPEEIRKIAEEVRDILREPEPYVSAGVGRWAAANNKGLVSHRALAEYGWPSIEDAKAGLAMVNAKVDAIMADMGVLEEAPVVDPVALAQALSGDPAFVSILAAAIAERLARVEGEITLTGSANLGIRPT